MSKEYIEREAVLKTPPFTKCVGDLSEYSEGYLDCVQDACEAVRKIPAVDVEPVRHGEWILHKDGSGTCNQCGITAKNIWDYDGWQNYCGHCGARMDGGNKREVGFYIDPKNYNIYQKLADGGK